MEQAFLLDLVHRYGYGVLGFVIGLESMGLPLPGEALLIASALYAVASGHLDIGFIVVAAATGAILGDNLGYLVGRTWGTPALRRWGGRIGLTPRRLIVGEYLFDRHGGKVVFFGRFTAMLRTFAALLAGANGMGWSRFLLWNALGGVVWAGSVGYGTYFLGDRILSVAGPVGITIGIGVVAAVGGVAWTLHRSGAALENRAVDAMKAKKRPAA